MASLQKKHAWWTLVFTDDQRQPQRKRVALKTRTKETAEKLRRQLEDDYARGIFDPWTDDPHRYRQVQRPAQSEPKPTTLREAYEAFLLSRSACREATVRHYRESLAPFIAFAGPEAPITRLTQDLLLKWLASLSCGPQSKATYASRVGIFSRYLMSRDVLSTDPTRRMPMGRLPDKLSAKLMTEADLSAFCNAAIESTAPYMADLVTVAFDAALRRKEVAALKVGWIDLQRRRLVIPNDDGFETKSGGEMVKPLTQRTVDVLSRCCQGKSATDHVFVNRRGKPLHDLKRLSRTFKAIARGAGLPESITLHSARHGGISRVIAGGASVEAGRRFAGHATTTMLMRYVHLHDDQYSAQVLRARFKTSG